MAVKILYPTKSDIVRESISMSISLILDKLQSKKPTLTLTEIMPLLGALADLGKLASTLEKELSNVTLQMQAYEAALIPNLAKPASDFATNLNDRMTATSNLLRATLDRLNQIEPVVLLLAKGTWVPIAENDLPRKKLAAARAKFEAVCLGKV